MQPGLSHWFSLPKLYVFREFPAKLHFFFLSRSLSAISCFLLHQVPLGTTSFLLSWMSLWTAEEQNGNYSSRNCSVGQDFAHAINQTNNKSLFFDTARTEMHTGFGRVFFSFCPSEQSCVYFLFPKLRTGNIIPGYRKLKHLFIMCSKYYLFRLVFS